MGDVSRSFRQWPTDQQTLSSLCSSPRYCRSDLRSQKAAVGELAAERRARVQRAPAEAKVALAHRPVPAVQRWAVGPRPARWAVVRRLEPLEVVLQVQPPVAQWAARQRAARPEA